MAMNTRGCQYALLMNILREEEKILPFLDVVFGFLYEKTDFFRNCDTCDGKLGFKPGQAENLVLKVFHKYENLAQLHDLKISKQQEENKLTSDLTNIGSEVEIGCHEETLQSNSTKLTLNDPIETAEHTDPIIKEKKSNVPANEEQNKRIVEARQIQSESYNGAVLENYRWSQSINDIDIRIPVPHAITSSKKLKVDLDHKHLKASIVDTNSAWITLADGQFLWKINLENSVWTLVPGEHIHINIEKLEERWWTSLFVGDPKIDVTQIESTKAYEDLPEDEQAQLEEMLFNEQQKMLGKPTSKDMKIHKLMKEAWNMPGSPFQGQTFDPSLYSVGSSDL